MHRGPLGGFPVRHPCCHPLGVLEIPVLVFGDHGLADDVAGARAGEEVVVLHRCEVTGLIVRLSWNYSNLFMPLVTRNIQYVVGKMWAREA